MTLEARRTAEWADGADGAEVADGDVMLDADFEVARRSFEVAACFRLAPGERLSIFGPSGAGKTTCLEAIAGTAPLSRGRVVIDGSLVNAANRRHRLFERGREHAVDPKDRGITVVRQPTTLFPHLSLAANVAYGLRSEPSSRDRSVEELLERVGLGGLGGVAPETLSGGQRQRACLARALARRFHAILLDEPFSAVDAGSRRMLREIAAEATEHEGAVAVLVTHDLGEAQAFAHLIAIMDAGQLLQLGDSDTLVRCPASVRVAELCGYESFLPHDSGRLWALHPDRFLVGSQPDRGLVLTGSVVSVQAFGPRYTCELVLDSPGTTVRVNVDSPPQIGESWEVTSLDPPLVSRVSLAGDEEGRSVARNPSTP
ncbi:MAG: ATP-binding cassette domain-containing protein [Actinomycetota bacterium]|nr:ATP-binding cassette domain-containing protein [Actinomycetota bacterium]